MPLLDNNIYYIIYIMISNKKIIIITFLIILIIIYRHLFFSVKINNTLEYLQTKVCTNNVKKIKQNNKILCFAGGGLRALTVHTGVIKGIIKKLQKNNNKNLHNFLSDYKIISGSSGGSWFVSLMIYSVKYFKLLDNDKSFTYDDYINNIMNNFKKESIISKKHKNIINYILKIIPNHIEYNNYIKPFLMYFYQPWQRLVYNLILKGPGDILNTTSVSCNPNKINNEIIWATSIMNQSIINESNKTSKKSYINVEYNLNNPNCQNESNLRIFKSCGATFPCMWSWDHNLNKSNVPLYPGKIPGINANKEKNYKYVSGYTLLGKEKKIVFHIIQEKME